MRKGISILLVLVTVLSLYMTGCTNSGISDPGASGETPGITFTDIAGREIKLESLPQKFIVANYIANFLMVGGAESLDKVVGMTFDGWEDTRYGEYKVFTEAFPSMLGGDDGIVSIGGYHDDVLNAELIMSLSPDVILMSNSQYIENNQSISTFEQAGIEVVVLDYHAQKLENHTKSTEILGMLLGREQIAKEQVEAYVNAINQVNERIESLPDDQKHRKVYVELGNKGVGEYGNSYNNNMLWGAIVNNIGGHNLGEGLDSGYGVLDKEFVITSNPDVIFIGGSIWSKDTKGDQMRMGFTIDEGTAQERLRGFAHRPEWQGLKAVKEGEVYGIDHGSLRNMIDYTFTQFMAKVLYPELFQDINPEKTINEYYEKYLPELKYTGTFMIKMQ